MSELFGTASPEHIVSTLFAFIGLLLLVAMSASKKDGD